MDEGRAVEIEKKADLREQVGQEVPDSGVAVRKEHRRLPEAVIPTDSERAKRDRHAGEEGSLRVPLPHHREQTAQHLTRRGNSSPTQTLYADVDNLDMVSCYNAKNLNAAKLHNEQREQFVNHLHNYNWETDTLKLKPIR